MKVENKKIVVVGLARSGVAMARFLAGRGARVTVTDQAGPEVLDHFTAQLGDLEVNLELGGHRPETFMSADTVVISPGVPHDLAILEKARQAGIEVIGEIELAGRFIQVPLVAITGTNGKTTVTEMVGRILAASDKQVFVGGNIGNPLIEIVAAHRHLDVVVAEVSSFQLDTTVHFRPQVAVLLNISADHLDRYPDMTAYAASKARIFANQTAADMAILNGDDPQVRRLASRIAAHKLPFYNGPQDQAPADAAAVITPKRLALKTAGNRLRTIDISGSALLGAHNRQNMAAAALAALAAGADFDALENVLKNFQPLEHRLEQVAVIDGVRFINDSKATNIDAVARALECFDKPVVLIMGGRNKGYDFNALADHVSRRVKKLIVMGEAAGEITAAVGDLPALGSVQAADMQDAVRQAFAAAEPGETVLLSPACASFDMFANYAQRGKEFRRQVEALV